MFRHVPTQTYVKWRKCNSVLKLNQISLRAYAGNAIGKFCFGKVTKNCVGGFSLGCYCFPSLTSRKCETELLCFAELLICYPPCQ